MVSATLDLQTLYETIYQQVGRVMDTRQFYIALLRPDRNTLDLTYHREAGELLRGQILPFGGNVSSLVVQRGTPVRCATDEEYMRFVMDNGLPEVRVGQEDSEAKIWVPLNTGNRTIGTLSVQSTRKHAYTEDDLQTLSVIASQAAVAIENARLFDGSQSNVRQMQALLSTAHSINGSLRLQTVLDSILKGMRDVIPYYVAAILLPNPHGPWLDIVGAGGPFADDRRTTLTVPLGEGITGAVFAEGKPLNVPDVTKFQGYITHGVDTVHSELAVPLRRGDSVVGVLDVEREE
ncbi:MAG: GAF domain-containing protein, partial [Chloroflexota bacterium]